MMAAVNMGISTMRRRPLRTLLTAITVVLLTFTILTFASFGSSWGIWLTYEGSTSGGPPHVFVRHQLWAPIGDGVFGTVRGFLSRDAQVVPRYWVSPTAQQVKDAAAAGQNLEKLLATGNCSRIIPVAAAIGLDIADLKDEKGHLRNEQMADLFESSAQIDLLADDGIFLTEAVSKELNLTPADIGKAEVLLAGWKFIYGGVVKDQLAIFKSLEGSDILPVDYESSLGDTLDTFTKSISTTTTTLTETPDIQSTSSCPTTSIK